MAEALRTTVRARFTRLVVVLAVVAGVLVVAFGTGYRVSQAVLDDGSAYLVKGRSVAHINAESGRSDADVARELAKGDDRLQIVQSPSGHVYVIAPDGTTTAINVGEMAPGDSRKGSPGETQVLGSGADTYVVDRGRGTVTLIDPDTLAVRRTVPTPGGVLAAAATKSGDSLWVLSAGRLLHVVDGEVAASTPVGDGDQKLTVVGGRPVLIDQGGTVRVVDNDKARTIDAGLPADGNLEVNQPGVAGSTVWVADEQSGDLIGVDVSDGRTTTTGLGAGDHANLGPAVTLGDKVYVPDYSSHVVRVVSAADGKLERTIPVTGTSTTFDLFVEDGRIWINDPAARSARVLDSAGRSKVVDKGAGHGVKDPGEHRLPSPPVTTLPQPQLGTPNPSSSKPGDAPRQNNPGSPDKPAQKPDPPTTPDPGNDAPAQVDVPATVGQPKDQACAALQAAGLGCSLQGIGTQQGVPPDQVVSSSPAAGEKVAAGTIVTVQYAGAITVPDLSGRTPTQACDELLTPAGLTCDPKPAGVAGDTQPVNVVTTQDPAPGTQVGGGSTVSFGFFDKFHIADYANPAQPAASVCQALATRPLTCSVVDKGAGPRGSQQNVVVDQSLQPGDYTAGQVLKLGVYTGENGDPIPNVVGKPAASACGEMAAAGYTDCAVVESPTPSNNPNTALSQSEPAGSVVRRGKHIEITQETTLLVQVCRYRRPGESVWVIRVGCNTSGVESWTASTLGYVNTGPEQGATQLFDNICGCAGRVQHQITRGGYNPDTANWNQQNGSVGFVFDSDHGVLKPLVRLIRDVSSDGNGGSDYGYATVGDPAYQNYLGSGFRVEDTLGYMWAP